MTKMADEHSKAICEAVADGAGQAIRATWSGNGKVLDEAAVQIVQACLAPALDEDARAVLMASAVGAVCGTHLALQRMRSMLYFQMHSIRRPADAARLCPPALRFPVLKGLVDRTVETVAPGFSGGAFEQMRHTLDYLARKAGRPGSPAQTGQYMTRLCADTGAFLRAAADPDLAITGQTDPEMASLCRDASPEMQLLMAFLRRALVQSISQGKVPALGDGLPAMMETVTLRHMPPEQRGHAIRKLQGGGAPPAP